MYFFGHLGIGLKIVQPWSRGLSRRLILLGTLLPDLIDKPLYYGVAWSTGLHGHELGILAGTRLFAHTALFLLALALCAALFHSRVLAAISLGVATHLLLDNLGDRMLSGPQGFRLTSLLWPACGWQFPETPYTGVSDQLSKAIHPFFFAAEIIGALILAWELWKSRNRERIVALIREQRASRALLRLRPGRRARAARSKDA